MRHAWHVILSIIAFATTCVPAGDAMAAAAPPGSPGPPPVPTLAALKAACATATGCPAGHPVFSGGAWRLDYRDGTGAPPLFYKPQTGRCATHRYPGTTTPMADDGGSCVDEASGNSFVAVFPGRVDWREFGASTLAGNNQAEAQRAVDAAWHLGLPVSFCGRGAFKIAAPIRYYGASSPFGRGATLSWCPGTVLQAAGSGGFALLLPASAPGDTHPVLHKTVYNIVFNQPNIDLNYHPGAGIVLAAVVEGQINQPNIYDIADTGTWPYTDGEGTGTLPNAGIVMAGSAVDNVENIRVVGGQVGNLNTYRPGAPYDWTRCRHMGGYGIAMTVPSQDVSYGNPPNGNTLENVAAACDRIGIYNPYGSDNTFIQVDGSTDSDAGIAQGSYGEYDFVIGGRISARGGDRVGIVFMSPTLPGSPVTETATSHAGDTTTILAARLARKITADLGPAGITATQVPQQPLVIVHYGEFALAKPTLRSGGGDCADGRRTFTVSGGVRQRPATLTGSVSGGMLTGALTLTDGGSYIDPPGAPARPGVAFLAGGDCAAPPTIVYDATGLPLLFNTTQSGRATISSAHSQSRNFMTQFQAEQNLFAGIFIGPNVNDQYVIDQPGSVAGSNWLVAQHGGPYGSGAPVIRSFNQTISGGTYISRDETVDCAHDTPPEVVDTSRGPVTITLSGENERGEKCMFVDPNGSWARHPLTLRAPSAAWGQVTIKGASHLLLSAGPVHLWHYGNDWISY
jgi:hypothetical protein